MASWPEVYPTTTALYVTGDRIARSAIERASEL